HHGVRAGGRRIRATRNVSGDRRYRATRCTRSRLVVSTRTAPELTRVRDLTDSCLFDMSATCHTGRPDNVPWPSPRYTSEILEQQKERTFAPAEISVAARWCRYRGADIA